MSEEEKRVFVAGHRGMVGSAIMRQLENCENLTLITRSREELDLLQQSQVVQFFGDESIHEVYMCAARVGGIHANSTYPAEFIHENLVVQTNVIHEAYRAGINRLLFLGSSCIYPRMAPQPMPESALLTGKLETTNEPYAIAKISGIKQCESYNRQYGTDFRSVMPTNLYGPNDNFHPENSHVIPALMRRIHEAKINRSDKVTIWGTGRPCREFMHVDDMAGACVFLMGIGPQQLSQAVASTESHVNIGTGTDVTIRELAETMATVVGFDGKIDFNSSKPDGMVRKLLDVSVLSDLGWRYQINLQQGLEWTYRWYCENEDSIRGT
jgi:GDP-L-fucose synthase